METRTLTKDNAAEYQGLRRRSLQQHPEAFGAFVEGKLTGIASLFRFPRLKTRHRAILGGTRFSLKT
jgi:hypothetical protein